MLVATRWSHHAGKRHPAASPASGRCRGARGTHAPWPVRGIGEAVPGEPVVVLRVVRAGEVHPAQPGHVDEGAALLRRADAAVHRGGARGRLAQVVGEEPPAGPSLADRVLGIVETLSLGKSPSDLLCTTDQSTTLHRSAVVRSLDWENTAAEVVGSMTSVTPRRACVWRVASTPGRSRRGSVTSQSRPRTATCTSSARRPIGRVWSASIGRGVMTGQ